MRFFKLFIALFISQVLLSTLVAQKPLEPIRTIKLPVPFFRGIWFNGITLSSWIFNLKLDKENDALVFEADKNGMWPLVRTHRWWTEKPVSETLSIPAWSSHDASNLDRLAADIQLTPDGRYAVTFATASWHSPSHDKDTPASKARPADTIITIVDLQAFKIIRSIHTLNVGLPDLTAQRILSDKMLALRGDTYSDVKSRRTYRLLLLPTLEPATQCSTGELLDPEGMKPGKDRDKAINDLEQGISECKSVLSETASTSLFDLDSLLNTGHPLPPRSELASRGGLLYPTTGGNWLALDTTGDSRSSISLLDATGQSKISREERQLLCLDQPVRGPAWGCSCEIKSVSPADPSYLLAECLTERDGLLGGRVWIDHWLSTFQVSDFAPVRRLKLPNRDAEIREVLASVDGKTYALAVTLGETLSVYELPPQR